MNTGRDYGFRLTRLGRNDGNADWYKWPRRPPSTAELIRHLMDQHGLQQKDLADVFGTPSIVSEVLSGKRELTKDHIKRLSRRFHLSPELFF